MNKDSSALLMATLLAVPLAAEAAPIYSIDMEVRNSTYAVQAGDTSAGLLAEFNSGSQVCDVALAAIDLVGSTQTCGGPATDIATLITLDLSQTSTTRWQFGADWGRGGVIYLTNGGSGERTYTQDIWWGLDWNSSQVIDFSISGTGSYTLGLLGFEACCGGAMSLRYSEDGGRTWQIAAVNVAEPGTLALLGLGLLGLGFVGRRKSA